jgi:hypothetical protein
MYNAGERDQTPVMSRTGRPFRRRKVQGRKPRRLPQPITRWPAISRWSLRRRRAVRPGAFGNSGGPSQGSRCAADRWPPCNSSRCGPPTEEAQTCLMCIRPVR